MEERGAHSWGYMTEAHTMKGLGAITSGLTIPRNLPSSFALHTRYATTGARVVGNSHPFTQTGERGTVVGVHNGIIANHAELNRDLKRSLVVDSQHIFQHLAEGRKLNDLEGYGAIVYQTNGEWYIGRFNDGDMNVVVTSAGILFASTRRALEDACNLAGLKTQRWLKVHNDTVYRITPDGLTKAYTLACARTARRWNDGIATASKVVTTTAKTTTTTTASARDWSNDDWRAHWNDQYDASGRNALTQNDWCELCYDLHSRLYPLDGDRVCAECYCELTDQMPHGYRDDDDDRDFPAYKLATRKQ
jgi:hypothetical protein